MIRKILFCIYIVLQSAIHIIVLPLKMLIAIISWFGWNPGFKVDLSEITAQNIQDGDWNYKTINYIANIKDDFAVMIRDKDGAKSMGIIARFFKNVGLYRYYELGEFSRRNHPWAFSADMDSGLLYGLYFRHKNNSIKKIDKLEEAVISTIYHYPFMKHRGSGNRGYKFKWWFMGDHWLKTLAWLATYKKIFPKRIDLKILYYFTYIISFPFAFLNPVTGVFIKRFMAIAFYNIHSSALSLYTAYKVTGNKLYRWSLRKLAQKHWYNPEISAFCLLCYDKGQIKEETMIPARIKLYLVNYTEQYNVVPREWIKWYFNLENFLRNGTIKTYYTDRILSSNYRRTMYDYAKKPMKNEDHKARASNIAYIHLSMLFNLMLKQQRSLDITYKTSRGVCE